MRASAYDKPASIYAATLVGSVTFRVRLPINMADIVELAGELRPRGATAPASAGVMCTSALTGALRSGSVKMPVTSVIALRWPASHTSHAQNGPMS